MSLRFNKSMKYFYDELKTVICDPEIKGKQEDKKKKGKKMERWKEKRQKDKNTKTIKMHKDTNTHQQTYILKVEKVCGFYLSAADH